MGLRREAFYFVLFAGLFAACFFLPVDSLGVTGPAEQALRLVRDYARHHVPLGLAPAVVIGGAIMVFFRRESVLRYLGPEAPRALAYGVASIGGAVLSVCSCGVLPLFAGIRRAGAGLGPACAFLYAGPAINVMAFVMTARVMGLSFSIARAVGAVGFSVAIGLAMSVFFRERPGSQTPAATTGRVPGADDAPTLGKTLTVLAAAVIALIFLNWSPSGFSGLLRCCDGGATESVFSALDVQRDGGSVTYRDPSGEYRTVAASRISRLQPQHGSRIDAAVYDNRFLLAALAGGCVLVMIGGWFGRGQVVGLLGASWSLARTIFPPLLVGVAVSGLLLGRPGHPGVVPPVWIATVLRGNSLAANLLAAVAAALMYFATLTEVPIIQGLLSAGMGRGPALAMLLAGPSVSLPALLPLCALLGIRKTLAYVLLVVLMATLSGWAFGALGW
ncbi:MAG: permease [Planctomycetota bacterium]|nr:permease [Planctomycetota bacterium]